MGTTQTHVKISGTLTNNGTINVQGLQRLYSTGTWGKIVNNGTINVLSGGQMHIEKGAVNSPGATINVVGTFIMGTYSTFDNNGNFKVEVGGGAFTASDGSTFNNNSGGNIYNYARFSHIPPSAQSYSSFYNKVGASFFNYSGAKSSWYTGFENGGKFVNAAGSSMDIGYVWKNLAGATFENSAPITSNGQIQNAGTVTSLGADVNATGSINNSAGGVWRATGTYSNGPFYNYGTIAPHAGYVGTVTFNHPNQIALDMRSTAVYNCDIAGTAGAGVPGGNDLIAVTGSVSYTSGAKIVVRFVGTYAPAVGTTFKVITKYGASGTPALVLPAGYTGQILDTQYDTTIKILTKP